MRRLIKNGIIVSAEGCKKADLLTENESIVEIAPDLTCQAEEVIDASGKYIFPGFIDTHTHFDLDAGDFKTADNFYTGTKAAVAGGTTTVLDFATQQRGETLCQALENWHKMAGKKCSCDYGFHMSISEWNPSIQKELKEMTRQGITSYKLYMAYDNLRVDDQKIYEILQAVREEHGIVGVHCENGDLVNELIEEQRRRAPKDICSHPKSRPGQVEAEAIHRLLVIAELADTPVTIVHLSTKAGLEEIKRARAQGQKVFVETCPQYLALTEKEYERPGFSGAAYVCSPPLRKEEDINALFDAAAEGEIDICGTDHCSFHMKGQKERGLLDFSKIPNGLPGVEHRPVLLYSLGVKTKKITIEQMCSLLSETPAKLFGMYPKKGALLPGSDADLVIWDPKAEWTITAREQMQNADYTPYEGMQVTGKAERVYLRGQEIYNNGKILTECQGQYIAREVSSLF